MIMGKSRYTPIIKLSQKKHCKLHKSLDYPSRHVREDSIIGQQNQREEALTSSAFVPLSIKSSLVKTPKVRSPAKPQNQSKLDHSQHLAWHNPINPPICTDYTIEKHTRESEYVCRTFWNQNMRSMASSRRSWYAAWLISQFDANSVLLCVSLEAVSYLVDQRL